MDRRQAIKSLGYGAGFLVATPTVMSLLQSCQSEPEFIPVFLSPGEGHALRRMVDLIIPSDESVPGAVDVGVHAFIDALWNDVLEEKDQKQVRKGFGIMAEKFMADTSKELANGKADDFDAMLSKYLKISKEEQKAYEEKLMEHGKALEKDPDTEPDPDAAMYGLLSSIRGATIWAWKNSEEIGENVLWYDPIPGLQRGCISEGELGYNGNVMAL